MTRGERAQLVLRALRDAKATTKGWALCFCPFCLIRFGKQHRKRALSVHASGVFHCFRCLVSGRDDVLRRGPGDLPERDAAENAPSIGLPEGFLPLAEEPGWSALVTEPARTYLRGRGLGPKLWQAASIGACVQGFWAGRVIVPVFGDGCDWLGWVGRAWTKHADVPYLYPRGMRKGLLLYNQATLAVETDVPALVVEGVFDALALWPDAVALLGKASEEQIGALLMANRPVVVVLDGDAWIEGWALAMRLRLDGARAGAVRLPPGRDPDEVSSGWLRMAARESLVASA